jgi:hypothetical protein
MCSMAHRVWSLTFRDSGRRHNLKTFSLDKVGLDPFFYDVFSVGHMNKSCI